MMYESWDTEHVGQNFLPFWSIFCTFTSITTQKIKILKNMKKPPGDILTLTITWCMVPEMLSVMERIFCHFGSFFSLLCPNNPENQNFDKLKKTPGDIISNMCTINDYHMMHGSWDIKCYGPNFLFWTIFCPFTP